MYKISIILTQVIQTINLTEPTFTHDYVEYEQDVTDIMVNDRLKEIIQLWRNIGACYILLTNTRWL